jgi:hypothetical protein
MKNIFIIPTNQPSRLSVEYGDILITDSPTYGENNQHLYITNDEEIKEGDWFIDGNNSLKRSYKLSHVQFANPKKIILTTDPNLIKEGVQSIDNEFLEWFEKNSSCEFVEVNKVCVTGCSNLVLNGTNSLCCGDKRYEIVYPETDFKKQQRTYLKEIMEADEKSGLYELSKQVEHTEETIKETFVRFMESNGNPKPTLGLVFSAFSAGSIRQAEKMYSKDEVLNILQTLFDKPEDAITYFEQFKK